MCARSLVPADGASRCWALAEASREDVGYVVVEMVVGVYGHMANVHSREEAADNEHSEQVEWQKGLKASLWEDMDERRLLDEAAGSLEGEAKDKPPAHLPKGGM